MPRSTTGGAIAILMFLLVSGGDSSPSGPHYDAAIQEGQTAAQEVLSRGHASALSIALTDRSRIIWSETFGLADREAGTAPTATTMFGVGSLSKLFATVAAMKLVDQGLVSLDTPLIEYLPDFRMASADDDKITVRMLLNHSAGFPGTDYRNSETTAPMPGYLDQVLQSLAIERLKAPPGFMNVYCNDCFTLIAALVQSISGKSFVAFVQDEILTPLGMDNTRYATAAFPDGSYAKAYVNDVVQPQEFPNTMAAGGMYSTANDIARFAMLFLGRGRVGPTRILSDAAVTEMAVDQTIGTFNPIRYDTFAYGLGWDTVTEPGLLAVGFDGWGKGGDVTDYGASVIVSPNARLGVVVIGASGFGSADARVIAQRVLLRALAENGRIAAFPSPLPAVVPPVEPVSDGLLADIAGTYAAANAIARLEPQPDGSLLSVILTDNGWTQDPSPLKHRGDGWFSTDENPLTTTKVVAAGGTQYLVKRSPDGHGHYLDTQLSAQRVRATGSLSDAWVDRLSKTWLVVNESPDSLSWQTRDPRLRLSPVAELDGLIAVRAPNDPGFHIVDASASDSVATMMLRIPQLAGRDLNDLDIVVRDGVEWTRFGSSMHMPLDAVAVLPTAAPSTVTIGPQGDAEWRAVAIESAAVGVDIDTTGKWRIYDASFAPIADGAGRAEISLPVGSGRAYIILFGDPGETVTVTVLKPA